MVRRPIHTFPTHKGVLVAINLLWIIIGAVLVIFMQAGFALVETGFCRAKHAAHVVATNFAIFGLGFIAFYYPLFGAMTWGGGWLAQLGNSHGLGLGYVDFAGSGVVHAMGGVAAMAGAIVLGPRLGKFGPDGKPRTIAGHHIPMAMLGTFILPSVGSASTLHPRSPLPIPGCCRGCEHCDCCGLRSDRRHGVVDAQEEGW